MLPALKEYFSSYFSPDTYVLSLKAVNIASVPFSDKETNFL